MTEQSAKPENIHMKLKRTPGFCDPIYDELATTEQSAKEQVCMECVKVARHPGEGYECALHLTAKSVVIAEDLRREYDAAENIPGNIICYSVGSQRLRELIERCSQAEAERDEWRDYFGCDSPHDAFIGTRGAQTALGQEQARSNRLEAERDELKAQLQRAMDLVRYQRGALLCEELIDETEYAALVADCENGERVARLETYDALRKETAALKAQLASQARKV